MASTGGGHSTTVASSDAAVSNNPAEADDDLDLNGFTNDSAMMIAYERDLETQRPDALFRDPCARVLQGRKGEALSTQFGQLCSHFNLEAWPEFHKMWTAARTRFIDDQIDAAAPGVRQLVNLGAGFDTRNYRLQSYKGLEAVFDVDMQVINDSKATILPKLGLEPFCSKVTSVSLDFLDQEKTLKTELPKHGFDLQKPSIFIAEGLIQYLGAGANKFLGDVCEVARCVGSVFVLNFLDASALEAWSTEDAKHMTLTESRVRAALLGHDDDKSDAVWDLQFFKFGEEALDYGRFDKRFPPSPLFSFVVAKRIRRSSAT